MTSGVFRALWPVLDPAMTLDELIAEADLAHVARLARARVTGRPQWTLRYGADVPGSGGAHTVLVAEAWAERVPRDRDDPEPDAPCPPTAAHPRTKRVHVTEVAELVAAGGTWESIAGRTGVHRNSLYQALHRAGRVDLIDTLVGRAGRPVPRREAS